MRRPLLLAVLVGLLLAPVATAHATSQLLGFGPFNGFVPAVDLNWSSDFKVWSFLDPILGIPPGNSLGTPSDSFGNLGLVHPNTYGDGTYAIAAHRDKGSGYLPLPLDADSQLSLNVTGAGAPTSPSSIQTLHAEHFLGDANTNQYGFGAQAQPSRFLWRFAGDDPTIYWAIEWAFSVTTVNETPTDLLPSASFSIMDSSTNTSIVAMSGIHEPGAFSGTAFGSGPLGSDLSFTYASSVSASDTQIMLTSQVRWAFSSEPITEFPTGVVPEPSTWVLLGSGLAGLAARFGWAHHRATPMK